MDGGRTIIHCLVPERLEAELLGDLRAHFASDDRVHVIVDRRELQRRASPREGRPSRSSDEERDERRRGTDRRRPVLPRWFDQLPPALAARAGGVCFVQRMLPVSRGLTAAGLHEVVAHVRAGDPEAPTELYWRLYERIHSRLSVLLGEPVAADRAAPTAFGRVLDAIDAHPDAAGAFDSLLYPAVDSAVTAAPAAAEPEEEVAEDELSLAIADPTLDELVNLSERDPRWFQRGKNERDNILRLARDHVVAAEHIGSTSVPAIAARPTVDLLVGVRRMQEPAGLRAVLLELGYERCGNGGVPGRAYYRRRGVLGYDVHVVRHGGTLWREALTFRDFLGDNPIEASRWAAAKREAVRAGGRSLMRYSELRAPALQEIAFRAAQSAQRAA